MKPFVPTFDRKVVFNAKWTGELKPAGISGYLQIVDAAVGGYHADGGYRPSRKTTIFPSAPRTFT